MSRFSYDKNTNTLTPIAGAPDVFRGLSGSIQSISGLVPAAHAGDENKFLCSDGTWKKGGAEFTAVVEITTESSELYGATITAKKNGMIVGTTTFSAQGSASYIVESMGTYIFECTYSGKVYTSDEVVISASVLYSATINATPDGKTVTPTDDIQTWLKCAMITDKSYTTLSEVLNDATTLSALMLSNNAVDYLARSTSWVSNITGNQTAMTDIGASGYCANTLLANSTWRTAICDSAYFEKVLNVKVPTMTSNTAPSGIASAGSALSDRQAWGAFSNTNDIWVANQTGSSASSPKTDWIQYKFDNPITVRKCVFRVRPFNLSYPYKCTKYIISASNDGNTFTSLVTKNVTASEDNPTFTEVLNNSTAYLYYRVTITAYSTSGTAYSVPGAKVQFYGRS